MALLLVGSALANDTELGVLAGQVQPVKSANLRLLREDLLISLGQQATVEVTFRLKNEGEATEVLLGFPYFSDDDLTYHEADDLSLRDFECRVDDQPVAVKDERGPNFLKGRGFKSSSWKVWPVAFGAGETRSVWHRYRGTVSSSTGNTVPDSGQVYFFEYLLTTGRNWKAPIGEFHLTVKPELPFFYPDNFYGLNLEGMTWDGGAFHVDRRDFVPEHELFLSLAGGYARRPPFEKGGSRNPGFKARPRWVGICPASGQRPLTQADLLGQTGRQLTLLRNEIYARRGRSFRDPQLKAHFASCDWYRPDPNYNDRRLGGLEVRNARFIQEYQTRHGLKW